MLLVFVGFFHPYCTILRLVSLGQTQIDAAEKGVSGSALYISTEPPVPIKRLAELAREVLALSYSLA